MAGESSRFMNAGFTKPKFMLDVHGKSLFLKCVNSFKNQFSTHQFIFIIRNPDYVKFIESELESLKIKDFKISILPGSTLGQAHTVFLGLEDLKFPEDGEITIFNIDSIRWNFEFTNEYGGSDGVLEVFEGDGDSWSFVDPGENSKVLRTTEKDRISNLCSTGLYYFRRYDLFRNAFTTAIDKKDVSKGEYYVAPLYNQLIGQGLDIKYSLIGSSSVDFLGTPDEYYSFINKAENS